MEKENQESALSLTAKRRKVFSRKSGCQCHIQRNEEREGLKSVCCWITKGCLIGRAGWTQTAGIAVENGTWM